MRVLFLAHRLPYAPNRGDRIRAYHLLREMSAWAEVDLIALTHDAGEVEQSPLLAPFVKRVTTAPVNKPRNLVRAGVSMLTGSALTHALLHSPALRPAVARVLQDRRPQVVFGYCTGVAPILQSPMLADLPLVLDMVDVDSEKWRALAGPSRFPMSWIYRRESAIMRQVEGALAGRAHVTTVVTDAERQALLHIAPGARVAVLPNGVDVDGFRRPDPTESEAPSVVFCGVLDYPPNEAGVVWFTTNVWPLVRSAHPRATFIIVGARPTAQIESLAKSAGVTLRANVPDVRPHLWSASLAVAPLLVARGVQNKVLEALAAGLPAVVTPRVAEGLPDHVKQGCRVAETPEEFARWINALLYDTPPARRSLAAQSGINALSWQSRLHGLRGLLEDAANRRA